MSVDDPRARDMLRAYRRQHALAPDRGAAIWDRLERSLDDGVAAPEPSERRPEPWYLRPRWVATLALAAGVVLALAIAPSVASETKDEAAPSQAVHAEDARADEHDAEILAPLVPHDPATPPRATPAAAPTQARAPDAPPAALRPSPRAPRRGSADEADALVVELGLVRRARRALQGGDAPGALALLDAHAHAFPEGQMLEDRLALRVEALCATGAERQARAEAKQLRRRFPRSARAFDEGQPCAAK